MPMQYNGLTLVPSKSASDEMLRHGLMIEDCKDLLENGYEPRKRKKGTTEKWVDIKNKTYNVVVVKSYNYQMGEEIYLITHVGCFTKKKSQKLAARQQS